MLNSRGLTGASDKSWWMTCAGRTSQRAKRLAQTHLLRQVLSQRSLCLCCATNLDDSIDKSLHDILLQGVDLLAAGRQPHTAPASSAHKG